ncbi:hypothetical protein [Algirhabdus cladophorae]|uniref:hypothetical protein n=1 Tax=Algirhabdus cladophorae TaxID=3377108 RepID=UPI003B8463F6
MMGFYTPQVPEPLGLDLAKLAAGGSCPTQFYGETHDGCDVYVRYRGGRLAVHVATTIGQDALDGRCVLQVDIGGVYDGTISLTQFCRHFGVTVNGAIPGETDPKADRLTDFTGQTTYWEVHLDQTMDQTSRAIVSKACAVFSQAMLVQPIYDKASGFRGA